MTNAFPEVTGREDRVCLGSVVLLFLAVQYDAVFVQPSHLNPQLANALRAS